MTLIVPDRFLWWQTQQHLLPPTAFLSKDNRWRGACPTYEAIIAFVLPVFTQPLRPPTKATVLQKSGILVAAKISYKNLVTSGFLRQ
jgi:hypothetical protein